MFEKDDFIIHALKIGAKDLSEGGDGLTYDDLKGGLIEAGYKIDTPDQHQKIWRVIKQSFLYPSGLGGDRKYFLKNEAYFSLLEYIELNEARKSSKQSMAIAIFAILLSVISLSLSVYFSNKQIVSPVTLNNEQHGMLLKAISGGLDKNGNKPDSSAPNK